MRKNYTAARAHAQERSDADGTLRRLRRDIHGGWISTAVPALRYQHGRDTEGELIQPSVWAVAEPLLTA